MHIKISRTTTERLIKKNTANKLTEGEVDPFPSPKSANKS